MPDVEVISTVKGKAPPPGWAYVPVIDANDSLRRGLPPISSSRAGVAKRAAARTAADLVNGSHNKSQATKVRLRLERLARDNAGKHDLILPEALKKDINEGRWKDKKIGKLMTTNIRRILGSEKNWTHHAADVAAEIEAMTDQLDRRRRKEVTQDPEVGTASFDTTHRPDQAEDEKLLLYTHVPSIPTNAQLDRLLIAPRLGYVEATATEPPSNPPPRKFCDMCSYWGKMKCLLCGSYVCSLACKQAHDAAEHPRR